MIKAGIGILTFSDQLFNNATSSSPPAVQPMVVDVSLLWSMFGICWICGSLSGAILSSRCALLHESYAASAIDHDAIKGIAELLLPRNVASQSSPFWFFDSSRHWRPGLLFPWQMCGFGALLVQD